MHRRRRSNRLTKPYRDLIMVADREVATYLDFDLAERFDVVLGRSDRVVVVCRLLSLITAS